MPFELASPSGLWLLGALAPLVALYVLRTRRVQRVVSSTLLWREARRDLLARHPFRRLLPEIPLLLEALALVLLAVSLARPAAPGGLTRAEHLAVVVDTSASMGATEGRGTRLDSAVAEAEKRVRSLPDGADALIVDAAREPRAVTGLEADAGRLSRALRALAVHDEPGDLARAVAFAQDRLGRLGGKTRIVLVTDVNADVPLGGKVPVDVVRVGAAADNTAIVRFEVRRREGPGGERVEAFAVVRHFGASKAGKFVTLRRRGEAAEIASRRVDLAPGEDAAVVLGFEAGPGDAGTGVVVDLSPADALAADDRAHAIIPPGTRLPVVLTPPHADPWLERAFAADPTVEVFAAKPDALGGKDVPRDALVVAKGLCPPAPPRGSVLVVAPPAGTCLGTRIGKETPSPRVTSLNEHDARLRFVSFDDVHLGRARLLEVPRNASLVRASEGTVVADLGLPGRSGTLVSFDPGDGDWPLRASFVLFVRNVTELARAARMRGAGAASRTGEPLSIAVPPGVTEARVKGPLGEVPARIVEGMAAVAAPARAGFYDAVGPGGELLGTAAVVFSSTEESDLRRTPSAAPDSAHAADSGALPDVPSAAWILALVAIAAAFADALYLGRGPRGAARRLPPRAVLVPLAAIAVAAIAVAAYAALIRQGVLPETFLRFGRPEWPVLGAVLTVAAALRLGTRAASEAPLRRALFEPLLAASVALGAFAASEPKAGALVDRVAIVVAVDRSRSTELAGNVAERVDRAIEAGRARMRPGDRIGVVAFGDVAALEEPLRERGEPRTPQRVAVGRDATDIAAGIRRALSETPPDAAAKIVLVSDGVATRGDAVAAALDAAIAGTPIDVLALEQRPIASVRVESLRAPSKADEGERLDLRLTTRATVETDVEVELFRDGVSLRKGRMRLAKGEDTVFLREKADRAGLARYEVHVAPIDAAKDELAEDNRATAFVRVTGPSRALVLEGDPGQAAPLVKALEAAAFRVETASATTAPGSLDELGGFDLVVLSDVPAADLPPQRLEELSLHVERLGGGLLLMGGDRSLGPGGYAATPVERVSPVSFDLKNERRRARLAEVIAIDYSGSMTAQTGGHTKLELANEAAARSAALLGTMDRAGVAHVDTEVAWTQALAPVNDPLAIGNRIRAVRAGGGGIYVDVAMRAAYAALEKEAVELKHLLLFADGGDAENRTEAPELARRALARNITTSVVSLGRGPDSAALEQISRIGKGRFYLIEDANRLPAVFAQETTLASRSALIEKPFRAAPGAGSAATRGVDTSAAPPLGGYVVTRPKGRAEVALSALDGDPLLATWAAGLGRAGVFTSDYKHRWGAAWTDWPDGARLFAQLGRDLSRRTDSNRVAVSAEVAGGTLFVRGSALDADGAEAVSERLVASVAGPAGFSRSVALEPTAPGAYAADLPLAVPGPYLVSVADEATHTLVGTAGAAFSPAEEIDPAGTDHALLDRIAELTSGKRTASLEAAFEARPPPRRAFRSLAPLLTMLSAAGLLASVAARRLSLPRRRARTADSSQAAEGGSLGGGTRTEGAKGGQDPPRTERARTTADSPPAAAGGPLGGGTRTEGAKGGQDPPRTEGTRTEGAKGGQDPPRPDQDPPRTTAEVLLERRRRRR